MDGFDPQEFANEYIAKQNRIITELVNKNIMLETQVSLLQKKVDGLKTKEAPEQKDDY